MSTNTFSKQPSEIIPISMDYQLLLNGIETISLLSVVIVDQIDNTNVTHDILDNQSIEGSVCKLVVKGGTHRGKYKITLKVATNEGNLYEEEILMKVYET